MGKRGPKPKPTELLRLSGDPKNKINANEPQCGLPPVKPIAISEDAIANHEWDRLIAAMPPKLYTALDVSALATYAQSYSLMMRADREIALNGLVFTVTVKDEAGNVVVKEMTRNPAVIIWNQAAKSLLAAGDRLGLNPSARSRLQLPVKNLDEATSRFKGLIGARAEDQIE